MKIARFEVLTAILQNSQILWDVTLCRMVNSAYRSTQRNVLEEIKSPNYNFIYKGITKNLGKYYDSIQNLLPSHLLVCLFIYLIII